MGGELSKYQFEGHELTTYVRGTARLLAQRPETIFHDFPRQQLESLPRSTALRLKGFSSR